jgi:hypothetical protein
MWPGAVDKELKDQAIWACLLLAGITIGCFSIPCALFLLARSYHIIGACSVAVPVFAESSVPSARVFPLCDVTFV